MKVSDIKGDFGKTVVYWVEQYVNNIVFDEIKMIARPLRFRDHINLFNMRDFKTFLSGVKVGVPTHACETGEIPYKSWNIHEIKSEYIKDSSEITIQTWDIDNDLFTASIDLVPEYWSENHPANYWTLHWCIQCKKDAMMAQLSKMFDEDLEKMKNTIHTDMLGRELRIGDIVCYSTTISNNVHIGTIVAFNDCNMNVDGSYVPYDANVLIVNETIELKDNKYVHKHK